MNNAFWAAAAELQWKVLMNELTWKEMCMNSNTSQEEEEQKKLKFIIIGQALKIGSCWCWNEKVLIIKRTVGAPHTIAAKRKCVTHFELKAVELFLKNSLKIS